MGWLVSLEHFQNRLIRRLRAGRLLALMVGAAACQPTKEVVLGEGAAASGGAGAVAFSARVTAFVLVDVVSRLDIRVLNDGDQIVRGADPITLRAELEGQAESVVYEVDGQRTRAEQNPPWTVAGNDTPTGRLQPWTIESGPHTVRATPFSSVSGGGGPGVGLENLFELQ